MLLSNEEFLEALRALFESRREHGSVFLTQKKYTYDAAASADQPSTSAAAHEPCPCLLRASDGGKTKISTLVQPAELERISAVYTSLLRSCFTTLRKRDKKKERQKKGKAANEPLKLPKIVGPRRGAGHSKRQASLARRLKALEKLKAARKRAAKEQGV